MSASADRLRAEIAELVRRYCAEAFGPKPFVPGTTFLPYGGATWRRPVSTRRIT